MIVSSSFNLVGVQDGKGVSSMTDYFQLSSSSTVAPDTWVTAAPVPTRAKKFLWTYRRTYWSDGSYTDTTPVVTSVYTPGRSYYPDGKYDSKKNYKVTAYSAPFVYEDGLYYGLTNETDEGVTGIDPKTDVADNGGNWEVFDELQFVMSKVLFTEWGKLGSAIFYEEYMMSQYGTDADGNEVQTYSGYKDFDYSDPTGGSFRPNILLNFLTGESWFRKTRVDGNIYGKTVSVEPLADHVLPEINGRYGMFYMDIAPCNSRSVVSKVYKASGTDKIVTVADAANFTSGDSLTITNNDSVLFFSHYNEGLESDAWAAVVIPYTVYDTKSAMYCDSSLSTTSKYPVQNKVITAELARRIQKVSSLPEKPEDDVLYVLT